MPLVTMLISWMLKDSSPPSAPWTLAAAGNHTLLGGTAWIRKNSFRPGALPPFFRIMEFEEALRRLRT